MAGMIESDIIATSFVADDPSVASIFPSAGLVSSAPEFQAVYWRCVAVFFLSARCSNPKSRLLFFSNVRPPRVDGVAIAEVLTQLGVELIKLPLTHRLPAVRAKNWGNVFYILDIMKWLVTERIEGRFMLLDSDVLVTASLSRLFATIARHRIVAYEIDTLPDHDVNGLSRLEMTARAERWGGMQFDRPVPHLGGEFIGFDIAFASSLAGQVDMLWQAVVRNDDAVAGITTEEQFWSVFLPAACIATGSAAGEIKRMWTDPRHNTVISGDETIPLWHLPSEKRHGFRDLFNWAKDRSFDPGIPTESFRVVAQRACGVPSIGLAKGAKDLVRRIARRVHI